MTSQRSMIHTANVRVDYNDTVAVRDLNLDIDAGEVFGLIGPNGAGKTSTIKVLATLLDPIYGEVYIDNIDAREHPDQARRIMGYMPDMAPVYVDLALRSFPWVGLRVQRCVKERADARYTALSADSGLGRALEGQGRGVERGRSACGHSGRA